MDSRRLHFGPVSIQQSQTQSTESRSPTFLTAPQLSWRLTKKHFIWSAEHQDCFEWTTQSYKQDTSEIYMNLPTIIHADTYISGLSATLSQEETNRNILAHIILSLLRSQTSMCNFQRQEKSLMRHQNMSYKLSEKAVKIKWLYVTT